MRHAQHLEFQLLDTPAAEDARILRRVSVLRFPGTVFWVGRAIEASTRFRIRRNIASFWRFLHLGFVQQGVYVLDKAIQHLMGFAGKCFS